MGCWNLHIAPGPTKLCLALCPSSPIHVLPCSFSPCFFFYKSGSTELILFNPHGFYLFLHKSLMVACVLDLMSSLYSSMIAVSGCLSFKVTYDHLLIRLSACKTIMWFLCNTAYNLILKTEYTLITLCTVQFPPHPKYCMKRGQCTSSNISEVCVGCFKMEACNQSCSHVLKFRFLLNEFFPYV